MAPPRLSTAATLHARRRPPGAGRWLAVALGALALGGCARMANNQGYIADQQLVTAIQPGVDTRESVRRTLGRPTFEAAFTDREWFYVTTVTGQRAFMRPDPVTHQVLVIRFDEGGRVETVERRGLDQVADIRPDRNRTPTLGRETGLLEDLFGNIGQFGAPGTAAPPGGGPM